MVPRALLLQPREQDQHWTRKRALRSSLRATSLHIVVALFSVPMTHALTVAGRLSRDSLQVRSSNTVRSPQKTRALVRGAHGHVDLHTHMQQTYTFSHGAVLFARVELSGSGFATMERSAERSARGA